MTAINAVDFADKIDLIRHLVEVAGAATYHPDGPPAAGTRVLLDVVDDKLKALGAAVLPEGGAS